MEKPYRKNAAVIITDGQGRVLLCKRNDPKFPAVQTVQGGIDVGETARQAAIREVGEEVGVSPEKVEIIAELPEKSYYDFAPTFSLYGGFEKYRGQEQTFFLAKVDPRTEFVLDADDNQEFVKVWWGTPEEFVHEAWDLKRPGIEKALRGFGLLA